MGHPVPKELKGEERLFVIPWLNVPVNKKSIIYNASNINCNFSR